MDGFLEGKFIQAVKDSGRDCAEGTGCVGALFADVLQLLSLFFIRQGTSSFSYPKMGIRCSSRSELDLPSQGSGNSLRLSIFPR